MLAAAERQVHADPASEIHLPGEDGDVGRGPLKNRCEISREGSRVDAGWRIQEHDLDVIGRRQAYHVASRVERREGSRPRVDVERRAAQAEG